MFILILPPLLVFFCHPGLTAEQDMKESMTSWLYKFQFSRRTGWRLLHALFPLSFLCFPAQVKLPFQHYILVCKWNLQRWNYTLYPKEAFFLLRMPPIHALKQKHNISPRSLSSCLIIPLNKATLLVLMKSAI